MSKDWWIIAVGIICIILLIGIAIMLVYLFKSGICGKNKSKGTKAAGAVYQSNPAATVKNPEGVIKEQKKQPAVQVVDETKEPASQEPSKNLSKDEGSQVASDVKPPPPPPPPAPEKKLFVSLEKYPFEKRFGPPKEKEEEAPKKLEPKKRRRRRRSSKAMEEKTSEEKHVIMLIAPATTALWILCMDYKDVRVLEWLRDQYPIRQVHKVYRREVDVFLLPISQMLKKMDDFADEAKQHLSALDAVFDTNYCILKMSPLAHKFILHDKVPAFVKYFAIGAIYHRFLTEEVDLEMSSLAFLLVIALQRRFSVATRRKALIMLRKDLPTIYLTFDKEDRALMQYPINLIESIYERDPAKFKEFALEYSESEEGILMNVGKKSAVSSVSKTEEDGGGKKSALSSVSKTFVGDRDEKKSAYSSVSKSFAGEDGVGPSSKKATNSAAK